MFGDIAPLDVFKLNPDANNLGERVINATSAKPASQDISLGMRFLADNFANEHSAVVDWLLLHDASGSRKAITCYHSPITILEEARVRFVLRLEVNISERDTTFSIKKKAVPGKADVSTDKAVPGCFHLLPGPKFGLGSNVALIG